MIKKIPDKEYFAIEALSCSGIKSLMKSPAHFKSWNESYTSPTPAMRLGTIVHGLILGTFDETVVVFEDGKTLASKAAKEFCLEHPDELVVTESELEHAKKIVEHQQSKSIIEWFPKGENEIAIVNEIDNIKGKCKFDSLHAKHNLAIDIKTCASIDLFERSFFRLGYHIQEAWYRLMAKVEGIDIKDFVFWAIETAPPYESKCYRVDEEVHEFAMDKIGEAMMLYRRCFAEDKWPGYSGDIEVIELPAYMR